MAKKSRTSKKRESLCTVSFTADELIRVMECLDDAIDNCMYQNEDWMPELRRASRKVLDAYQERPLERHTA